jgi:hypothetical protein
MKTSWFGSVFVGILVVLSVIYLFAVFWLLHKSMDAGCIVNTGTVKWRISGWDLGEVKCQLLGVNEVGDYVAGLVSILATVWLIVAFTWQAMELAHQRHEFSVSNGIALSRAAGEDVWRKIELWEALRDRLMAAANGVDGMKADLLGQRRGNSFQAVDEVRDALQGRLVAVSAADFEGSKGTAVLRVNEKIEQLGAILLALDELRHDPQLLRFGPLLI